MAKEKKQDCGWQFPKALEIVKCKEGNKEFMKERPARRPFGNTVLICEYPLDGDAMQEPNARMITWRLAKRAALDFEQVAAVVRLFSDEHTEDTPKTEKKRGFTEKKTKCPHCGGEVENAVIYADEENKEYFVYCPICGIETAETYTSKAKALKAFADGKTKPISGKEAGGGE